MNLPERGMRQEAMFTTVGERSPSCNLDGSIGDGE